ncbi:tRNA1(Val) (adenine(37)-N6)-methyltransferase [Pseudoalteromonas mariniglutinosa]|uniref:tRNA1(Val) (adenine(37)-N6)-methyltransferase n=1 Tax=Pseudoalteromonas mariniglutinosa TaxID=206042 RepID=UPI0038504E52
MSGFVFKQFTVMQTRSAMKVSTDGILLGAWAELKAAKRLLDIGTGTGLIALMCKQRRTDSMVVAIEIDEQACLDAKANFAASNWSDISLHQGAVQDFTTQQAFDVVISNPPYFNHSLKGNNAARNVARHTDGLTFAELIDAFKRVSHQNSVFNLILPCPEADLFIRLAQQQGLYLQRHCLVQTTVKKMPSRSLMCFSLHATTCDEQSLCIYTQSNQYSADYIALCKDFYLKM